MRAVDNSTNRARSAEAERYRNVLPFLGRAWQDMVLTRAARGTPAGNRGVAVPSAATARADALRLKRRGELATEALETIASRPAPSSGLVTRSHKPIPNMAIKINTASPTQEPKIQTTPKATDAGPSPSSGTLTPGQKKTKNTARSFETAAPVQESKTEKKAIAARPTLSTGTRLLVQKPTPNTAIATSPVLSTGMRTLDQKPTSKTASKFKTAAAPAREPKTEMMTPKNTATRAAPSAGTPTLDQKPTTKIASPFGTARPAQEPRTAMAVAVRPAPSERILRLPRTLKPRMASGTTTAAAAGSAPSSGRFTVGRKPTTKLTPGAITASPGRGVLTPVQKPTTKMARKFESATPTRESRAKPTGQTTAARPAPSPEALRPAKKSKKIVTTTSKFKTAASVHEPKTEGETSPVTTTAKPAAPSPTIVTPTHDPTTKMGSKFTAAAPVEEPKKGVTPDTITARAASSSSEPVTTPTQKPTATAVPSKFRPAAASAQEPKTKKTPETPATNPAPLPRILTPARDPKTRTASKFKTAAPTQQPKTNTAPKSPVASLASSPGTSSATHRPSSKMASELRTSPPIREPKAEITSKSPASSPVPSSGHRSPTHKLKTKVSSKFKAAAPAQEPKPEMTPETIAARPAPSLQNITPVHKPKAATTPGKFKTAAPVHEPNTVDKTSPTTAAVRPWPSPRTTTPIRKPTTRMASKFKTAATAQEPKTDKPPKTAAGSSTSSPGVLTPVQERRKKTLTPERTAARVAASPGIVTPTRKPKARVASVAEPATPVDEKNTDTSAPDTTPASSSAPAPGIVTPTHKPKMTTMPSKFRRAAPAREPKKSTAPSTAALSSTPSPGVATPVRKTKTTTMPTRFKTAAPAPDPKKTVTPETTAARPVPSHGTDYPTRKQTTKTSSKFKFAAPVRESTRRMAPESARVGPTPSPGSVNSTRNPISKMASKFKTAAPPQEPKTRVAPVDTTSNPVPPPESLSLAKKLKQKLSRRTNAVTSTQEPKTQTTPDDAEVSPALSPEIVFRPALEPPATPASPNTDETPAQEAKTVMPLLNTDALLKSRKPVIGKVSRRFQRCVLEVDDDGNCYGTSWVLSVLLWAVQSPTRLQAFLDELEDASSGSGAFVDLDDAVKIHVASFVSYVRNLEKAWQGHEAGDAAFGVSLAVGVVTTLLGSAQAEGAMEQKEGSREGGEAGPDPQWLRLKWGVALVSRAFDVWSAFTHGLPREDVDKLRTLCQSVEFDIGREMAAANSSTADDSGNMRASSSKGVMRLGHVVNMVVLWPAATGIKELNLNEALGVPPGATPERTVKGLSLLKGGLPHFDVEVSADTPLAEALAAKFELPEVSGVNAEALHHLQQQSDSQRETTKEELEALISPSELVAQTIVFKRIATSQDDRAMAAAMAKEEEEEKDEGGGAAPELSDEVDEPSKSKDDGNSLSRLSQLHQATSGAAGAGC